MRLFLLINPTYQMPFQLYQMAFNALKKQRVVLNQKWFGSGKKVVHQRGNQTLYHRIDKCYQFFEKLRLPHFRVKLRGTYSSSFIIHERVAGNEKKQSSP